LGDNKFEKQLLSSDWSTWSIYNKS